MIRSAISRSAFAVAGLMFLSAPAPARAQGVSFDRLLGGLLEGCEVGKPLRDWSHGLAAAIDARKPIASIRPPADVAAGVGAVKVTMKSEWKEIDAPLSGTLRGLSLARVVYHYGNENGVYVIEVVFAEPIAKISRTLGKVVRASNARLRRNSDSGGSTELLLKGPRYSLVCDLST